ncbi:UNVERIFIED_CONTAM: hypothetical protein Slati_1328200 [Sesamum latifolium]|uniref:Uncharacterized protein n=1 Tax=Sesamum latifolium TaxID=2727402 RepID=A0AAW2XIA4_9LAMI
MEQPQGFVSKKYPNHMCRLKKAYLTRLSKPVPPPVYTPRTAANKLQIGREIFVSSRSPPA